VGGVLVGVAVDRPHRADRSVGAGNRVQAADFSVQEQVVDGEGFVMGAGAVASGIVRRCSNQAACPLKR
jgi:hypothetical protein